MVILRCDRVSCSPDSRYTDEANSWTGISEFDLLARNVTVPGLSRRYPTIHCTASADICQLVTDEGEINAAISTSALIHSPLFNLHLGMLGSVAYVRFSMQVAPQYQMGQYALRRRAVRLAHRAELDDAASAQQDKQLYASESEYAVALQASRLLACDTTASDVWWSGALLGAALKQDYAVHERHGVYCKMQAQGGRSACCVGFDRVVAMRTARDFDRSRPGMSATDNLFDGHAVRNVHLAAVQAMRGVVDELGGCAGEERRLVGDRIPTSGLAQRAPPRIWITADVISTSCPRDTVELV
ncbi:purine nucleoside permease-domain-containing protein [Dichomitus squalens]|nr:purine nucleoside permease-domain-containing protein [Dichomitus squalens]